MRSEAHPGRPGNQEARSPTRGLLRATAEVTISAHAASSNGRGLRSPLSGPCRHPLTPFASERIQEDIVSVKTNTSMAFLPRKPLEMGGGQESQLAHHPPPLHLGSQERGYLAVNQEETFSSGEITTSLPPLQLPD